MSPEIKKYTDAFGGNAIPIIREAGAYIAREYAGFDQRYIEVKERNSLVSYVDKTAERMLVQGLGKLFPDAGWITEEDVTSDDVRELTWVIDPLDGTTNFLQGIPMFCVSVGLQYRGKEIAGAIYDPLRDEMFCAYRGQGATLNDTPIQVSGKSDLSEAIMGTGFPYHDMSCLAEHVALLQDLLLHGRGMRRLGSAALDLAYVACGRLDTFYEHTLNLYDVSAGMLIAREGGAIVSNYAGTEDWQWKGDIVASTPSIHADMVSRIRQHIPSMSTSIDK